ncbi:MAG: hypothetical protein Ct9H90mP26_0130 [Methanobacteriota archaeon]|nr:MAG: hypothetical protein Ct9H90mP26_0130 [Euryarchaeota archaeon]
MSARDAAKIPKRIDSIRFTLMDPNEIRKMSSVEVKTADTYKDDGHAFKQGLMDPKMGVIDPGIRCETCGNKHEECPSHFGHIALELPVMHIGFTGLIKTCLKQPATLAARPCCTMLRKRILLIQRSPSRTTTETSERHHPKARSWWQGIQENHQGYREYLRWP